MLVCDQASGRNAGMYGIWVNEYSLELEDLLSPRYTRPGRAAKPASLFCIPL
jgi:hypothetical protein